MLARASVFFTLLFKWDVSRAYETLGSQQFVVTGNPKNASLDERIVPVSSDGSAAAFSGQLLGNCAVHIGCYKPFRDIRPRIISLDPEESIVGPHDCFRACVSRNFAVAAVNGKTCACSTSVNSVFYQADSPSRCGFLCAGSFTNPLCGGDGDYWSLIRCYSYEQISSLAVDPFRDISFKTVTIDWMMENDLPTGNLQFDRSQSFLFASDLTTGAPLLQYQLIEVDPDNVDRPVSFSALRFDIDSSRLVGLILPGFGDLAAQILDPKLVLIDINTTVAIYPILTARTFAISTPQVPNLFSSNVILGEPVNGLISRNEIQSFIFSIAGSTIGTSILIFVDISSPDIGKAFLTVGLDCIPTQLAVNDYYGDVAILASRLNAVQFIAIATVYRDSKTGQLTAQSHWDPLGINLKYVAAVTDTQNLNLIAGVSASIPMQNQSCHGIMLYTPTNLASSLDDRQLLLSQPGSSSASLHNGSSVPSVVCFDIRNQGFMQLWGSVNGTARTTQNGTVQTAVTMNLFQTDPGYPMTLSRPEMKLCEISATALTLTIKFDSVTLMGGKGVDTNNDGIPDVANMSTQVVSPVNASICFADSSLSFLVGATCFFPQGDVIVVNLDRILSTVTFNDAICIRPNFVCRNQGIQWSPYATGCCKVTLPPDLAAPKPVLVVTPSLNIDVCSDIRIDLSDSLYCGRGCTFNWTLTSISSTGGSLSYSEDILAQFAAGIQQLLLSAKSSVAIPAVSLPRSAQLTFNVTITSSWQRSSAIQFVVEKLSEPAPTVSIPGQGQSRMVQTQMNDYTISAVGQISGCKTDATTAGGRALNYVWKYANCSVSLERSGILATQNVLHVPGGTHVCPSGSGWLDEGIGKVVCEICVATVSVFLQGSPQRNSTSTVTIAIVKSAVIVKCLNPDSGIVTRGPVWFINCANSLDLDDPSVSPFQGNFALGCSLKSDPTTSCFPGSSSTLMNPSMVSCMTDYTQPRVEGDGGAMYPQVILSSTQPFCRLSRGIVAINTIMLPTGSYVFNVSIVHFDNLRSATKAISVELTNIPMPKVSMAMFGTAGSNGRYPTSTNINVQATVTLDVRAVNVTYTWVLLSKQLNKEFDQLASQRALARGDIYSIPQYKFIPTSILSDCKAARKASFDSSSPTLLIAANCLDVATDYAVRLNISWVQAETFSTYSELVFSTANGPPRGGSLNILGNATTCEFPKTLSAETWASDDSPLNYRFGYLVGTSKYWFTDAPQPVRSISGLVPCGSTTVFVQVTSSAGEVTFAFLQVYSSPPAEANLVAQSLINSADSYIQSDPTQAFAKYMTAISLAPDDPQLGKRITDSVASTQCSSADCGNRVLVFLNALAKNQTVSVDPLIAAVEQNVQRISSSDPSVLEHAQTVMNSLAAAMGTLWSAKQTSTPMVAARINKASIKGNLVTGCEYTRVCAIPGQICLNEDQGRHVIYICCDSTNLKRGCRDQPCWFEGSSCDLIEKNGTTAESVSVHAKPGISLEFLKDFEKPHLEKAVAWLRAKDEQEEDFTSYVSRFQPEVQRALLSERETFLDEQKSAAINASLLFNRIEAARQVVVEKIVTTLVRNQPPVVFETEQFTLTVGKTTDMSSALSAFKFPNSFTVPKSSPDVPTENNPVTGFSFMYVQYKTDPFSWAINAEDNPIASSVVTLRVMKADPSMPLVFSPAEKPIRLFADQRLPASGTCKRFEIDELSWTGKGAVNDDQGCLVTRPGTFAIFVDPSFPSANRSEPVNVVNSKASMDLNLNLFPIGTLIGMILLHAVFMLWGHYKDRGQIDPPKFILLDGDGINSPTSIDDPIAYGQSSILKLHLHTFRNVLIRRLIIAWPLTYHPIKLRIARVALSCLSMTTCAMMSTVLIDLSQMEPATTGLLASLISFTTHSLFQYMLDHLPHPARLRISKGVRRSRASLFASLPVSPRVAALRLPELVDPIGITRQHPTEPDQTFVYSPRVIRERSRSPPPPPPLTEDTRSFVRRVKDVYAERSLREHEKELIAIDTGEVTKPVPEIARIIMIWLLSLSLTGVIVASIITVGLRSIYWNGLNKNTSWTVSASLAITLSLTVLDSLSCLLVAEIEISRFSDRKNAHDSRVPKLILVPSAPPQPISTETN
jgi:hypothetical protein